MNNYSILRILLAAALLLPAVAARAQQGAYADPPKNAPGDAPSQDESADKTPVPLPVAEPTAEPTLAPPAAKEAARVVGKPVMGALIEPLSREPIDFSFKDADILGILRGFAIKFDKNIIAGSGVSGRVNLNLKNVPFDEAFRILLNHMNLIAVQKSPNVIEIIRASEVPALSQVFSLKYRFALELNNTINALLNKKERETTLIAVDQGSNALIVTATNELLQKIKSIIDALDIEPPQISIKARLIEVGVGDALNTSATFGLQNRFNRGGMNGNGRVILNQTNFKVLPDGTLNTNEAVAAFPTGGILDIAAILDSKTVYGLLNALQTDSRNKTISEPMILTGNNKSSKIHVGQNLPVKVVTINQNTSVQNIQYIPEGIDLDVTPIVSPGSNIISFKIRVGVSELLGFQDNAPIVTERVASTEVSVESGKTVVIGGLMKDKSSDLDAGIPILKNIPLIGWLFKTKRKTKEKTELLIFITPELLTGERKLPVPME